MNEDNLLLSPETIELFNRLPRGEYTREDRQTFMEKTKLFENVIDACCDRCEEPEVYQLLINLLDSDIVDVVSDELLYSIFLSLVAKNQKEQSLAMYERIKDTKLPESLLQKAANAIFKIQTVPMMRIVSSYLLHNPELLGSMALTVLSIINVTKEEAHSHNTGEDNNNEIESADICGLNDMFCKICIAAGIVNDTPTALDITEAQRTMIDTQFGGVLLSTFYNGCASQGEWMLDNTSINITKTDVLLHLVTDISPLHYIQLLDGCSNPELHKVLKLISVSPKPDLLVFEIIERVLMHEAQKAE